MGVGRIFPGKGTTGFFLNFSRGGQKCWSWIFPTQN